MLNHPDKITLNKEMLAKEVQINLFTSVPLQLEKATTLPLLSGTPRQFFYMTLLQKKYTMIGKDIFLFRQNLYSLFLTKSPRLVYFLFFELGFS